MAQYKKLFDKSEIEYITPFLKLWMSFNNWYKQDLSGVLVKVYDKDGNIKKNADGTDKEKNITTDAEAINYYKTGGQVKTEFIKLLNSRSPNDEPFQNGLSSFVKLIQELNNPDFKFSTNLFYQNPAQITITANSLIYISPTQKEYYYSSGDEDRLYEETLTLIYKIRCSLIHGDFDIEDRIFIGLIETLYRMLYPIMERILSNEEAMIQNKEYFNKSYFSELETRVLDVINSDFEPMRKIIEIYVTSIDFVGYSDLAIITNSFYKKILGKGIRDLKEEKGGGRAKIYDSLSDSDKKKLEDEAIKICQIAEQKAKSKIPMTMEDWKKEFNI